MLTYSFYLLDITGMTYDYLVRSCRNDEDARESARRLCGDAPEVEIWNGTRMVARITAAADDREAFAHSPGVGLWSEWRTQRLAETIS
jgi:hypothetical protein